MRTDFWTFTRGSNVDPKSFMDPREVAQIIVDALDPKKSAYVSDLIISR